MSTKGHKLLGFKYLLSHFHNNEGHQLVVRHWLFEYIESRQTKYVQCLVWNKNEKRKKKNTSVKHHNLKLFCTKLLLYMSRLSSYTSVVIVNCHLNKQGNDQTNEWW